MLKLRDFRKVQQLHIQLRLNQLVLIFRGFLGRKRPRAIENRPPVPQEDKCTSSLNNNPPKSTEPQRKQPIGKKGRYEFRDLALSKVQLTHEACDFCQYECAYGLSNETLWLPQSAATGSCSNCTKSSDSFLDELMVTEKRFAPNLLVRGGEYDIRPMQESLPGSPMMVPATARPKRTIVNGFDVSKYQKVLFCRGCSWRQLDLTKVKICEDCRSEKSAIIHHRHEGWVSMISKHKSPRQACCMICTSLAVERCAGCPLRLCSGCQVILRCFCKRRQHKTQ